MKCSYYRPKNLGKSGTRISTDVNRFIAALSRQPFITILTSTIVGILIGFRELPIAIPIACLGVALAIFVALLLLSRKPAMSLRLRDWHWSWISLSFIGFGMLCSSSHYPKHIDFGEAEYKGYAFATIEDVETTTDGDRLRVKVESFRNLDGTPHDIKDFNAVITTGGTTLQIGDRISFLQDFEPIVNSRNYQGSDYASYMLHNGIRYRQYCDPEHLHYIDHQDTWKSVSTSIRDNLVSIVERSSLQRPTQNFIITMLLGDKDYMPDEVNEKFSDAGIAHILALSGLHMGIIALILSFLLYPLRIVASPKWIYLLTIIGLWTFAFITGMSPSVVRAAVMATFYFSALILERHNDSINSLLAAVTFIVIADPLSIFNIGLQLSATTVASILLLTDKFNFVNRFHNPRLYNVVATILTTLTAVLGSWILTAHYFHTFPLMFLPINVITIPLLPLYIGIAILHITLSAFGIDFIATSVALDYGYKALMSLMEWLTLDGSVIENVWISPISIPVYFCFIVLLSMWLGSRKRLLLIYTLIALSSGLLIALTGPTDRPLDGFIIQDRWDDNLVRVYYDGNDSTIQLPRNRNSLTTIYGKSLMCIDDNRMTQRMIDQVDSTKLSPRPCDYLILCKGYRGNIADLLDIYAPTTIVLMPEIFDTKEKALIREGQSIGVNLYSISQRGALQHLIHRD